MTHDQMKKAVGEVKSRPRAAMIGGLAGLALLIGWLAYDAAATPSKPVVQNAPAAEVVAFISNERGLASLPQIEQERFLRQWREHILNEPHKTELKRCLQALPDDERKAFTSAIMRQFKQTFLSDARQYAALSSPEEKFAFVRARVESYREEKGAMIEIASALKSGVSGTQEDLQQWILEHTTPEERAIGEPYYEALQRVREQLKKQQRVAAESKEA